MNVNIVKTVETSNYIFRIVSTPNWRDAKIINPKIPKYLVEIENKKTNKKHAPTDRELWTYKKNLKKENIRILSDLLKIKEEHNIKNLRRKEKRYVEIAIHKRAEKFK